VVSDGAVGIVGEPGIRPGNARLPVTVLTCIGTGLFAIIRGIAFINSGPGQIHCSGVTCPAGQDGAYDKQIKQQGPEKKASVLLHGLSPLYSGRLRSGALSGRLSWIMRFIVSDYKKIGIHV
jgi:hypothetical protein